MNQKLPFEDPLELVERLCQRLIAAWRTGSPVRIEALLEETPVNLRDAALEDLIAEELVQRAKLGERPEFNEYKARFPERLNAAFRGYLHFDPQATAPLTWKDPSCADPTLSEVHNPIAAPGPSPCSSADEQIATRRHIPTVSTEQIPRQIGDFEIVRILGYGSFGRVFLAIDTKLQRKVAIKEPLRDLFEDRRGVDLFLDEARVAANLDHRGLVRVYEVFEVNGQPYIVQEFIEGSTLREFAGSTRATYDQIVNLMIEIVDAIGHLHSQRFTHRDLKPENILIDSHGHARVVDFGLAIRECAQWKRAGEQAGTECYMSPELLRGETHLLDGRSDLWSIGVILYELLVGSRPFPATNSRDLRDQIRMLEPRPPRQIVPKVPAELERICLSCLRHRRTERYGSAAEMLDDLRCLFEKMQTAERGASPQPEVPQSPNSNARTDGPSVAAAPLHIVPKGLRPFDERDAEFFLDLLPGARDRDGLPESIRFWKTQIEEPDPDKTFSVGLIYGPSGCGKSSLVKAGLLPRLGNRILSVYVEATACDTEVRLLKGLKKRLPYINDPQSLPDTMQQVRRRGIGGERKLLIVLDQFEQWLLAHSGDDDNHQLIDALRHCDGGGIQCLVMVRDDFWMPATRFMRALEVKLIEGHNSNPVDLFSTRHAEEVLAKFGRAFEALPVIQSEQSPEQMEFLRQAVSELAKDGKVICVRLSLFAEMMKGKPWTPASLQDVGGTEGVGVRFLHDTLNAITAAASHRPHIKAAREVLKALLPKVGTDIKGNMRAHSDLLNCSGYDQRPSDFQDLMRMLDSELRLITPTDPEGISTDLEELQHWDLSQKYFQLTHDYLVPSLRKWLDQVARESPAERAKLKLQSLADSYRVSGDKRFLPTLWDFLDIARYVRVRECEDPERKVYWLACRKYSLRAGFLFALLIVVGCLGYGWRFSVKQEKAKGMVSLWTKATPSALAFVLPTLESESRFTITAIKRRLSHGNLPMTEKQRLDLGLSLLTSVDGETIRRLIESIDEMDADQLPLLRRAFARHSSVALPLLETKFSEARSDEQAAKLAMVLFHLGQSQTLRSCLQIKPNDFRRLTAVHWLGNDLDTAIDFVRYVESAHPSIDEHDLLAGLVKGLGRMDWSREDAESRMRWIELLKTLHIDTPSGAMRSASEYALRRQQVEPPVPSARTATIPKDKNWFADLSGLTFVKIPATGKQLGIKVEAFDRKNNRFVPMELGQINDFWMSTTEIPAVLMDEYTSHQRDVNAEREERPEDLGRMPATNIHAVDAMRYCNELSKKAGLTPCYIESSETFQPYDQIDADYDFTRFRSEMAGLHAWSYDNQGSGYRLPNIAELFFAACAESGSAFPEKTNSRLFAAQYSWYSENSEDSINSAPNPIGQLMPNDFGLFDITGNAFEFAIDNRSKLLPANHFALFAGVKSSIQDVCHPTPLKILLWQKSNDRSFRLVRSRVSGE